MRPIFRFCLALLLLPACTNADQGEETGADTDIDPKAPVRVNVDTTLGSMVFELDLANAPITAKNFLVYVDEGFFDGSDGLGATSFHRVITGFMVQGGGFTEGVDLKATHDPIVLESENGLFNVRGSLAMARTDVADSATSQFYVNLVDNDALDYRNARDPGYAVFGTVVEGMDVVDQIAAVPVDAGDAPLKPVMITACARD